MAKSYLVELLIDPRLQMPNVTVRVLSFLILLGAMLYGMGLFMDQRPAKGIFSHLWRVLTIAIVMTVWGILAAAFVIRAYPLMGGLV